MIVKVIVLEIKKELIVKLVRQWKIVVKEEIHVK
jgi:hypothetical protein